MPPSSGSSDSASTSRGLCVATSSATARGEGQELFVLRDEIGFAIDFDDRADLAVAGDMRRHHAFGRDAPRRFGRLVAELDRAGSLRPCPRSPPASVSAFLHSIIGASVFSRSSFTMPAVISAID